VRLPYHLSTLSQAAATVALRHADETLATVAKLRDERVRVVAALSDLGYRVVPSESNFVFFAVPDHADAHDLWQKFLDLDVLIRDVGVPGHLRMTVGLPAENDAFLAAADKIIGEYK
jgi:histidinol-phosphate aminotransferase